jgi:hypothetical protein
MRDQEALETMSPEEVEAIAALRDEYEHACEHARVPSAGLVWWRATIRARAESARKVEQPLSVTQALVVAAIAGAACASLGLVWRAIPAFSQPSLLTVLGLALAACVVVAPLALVLALGRE